MKNKELTTNECMEIFKKYDKDIYEYYMQNAWFFGCNARNYAKYLKEKHETKTKTYGDNT